MTLEEYRALVLTDDCRWCGKDLPQKIDAYPHDDGWTVTGEAQKQWLSIKCSCGYDWSLWKLGVKKQ